MTFLTKLGITTIAAGTITLGAVVLWNGGNTIDTAIQTIEEQASKLSIFSQNEERLVEEIQTLITERDLLLAQLDSEGLKDETIESIQAELEEKNARIAELEEQLSNAETNGNELAERIDLLTVELEAANADAERLQTAIDENQSVEEPMSNEEIDELVNGSEEVVEEYPTTLSYKYGDTAIEVVPGIVLSTDGSNMYKLMNNSGSEITVSGVPGESVKVLYNANFRLLGNSIESIIININGTVYTVNVSL